MLKPRTQDFPTRQLLWHAMMGTALGILCGGLRLATSAPYAQLLIDAPASSFSRLEYLVELGLAFGILATLTGAFFLKIEQS
jgi:hypothetical protein